MSVVKTGVSNVEQSSYRYGENMNRKLLVRIALVAVIAGVLAGLMYFMPKPMPATDKTFTLVLKDYALVSGPSRMMVNQGDTVTLRVKSNRGGHLMIHGYDQELAIGEAGESTLTFVVDKSGRFFMHVHAGEEHIPIATIEIQPR